MSSYIKSEFYRILRNKWTYLFIVICSGLLISSNLVLGLVRYSDSRFPYGNTAFSIGNFISSMSFVFFLCITVSYMIFGSEYTNHTMKNSISYGIDRGTLYFGKLIVEIIYSMIAFVIITGAHVASAYLLLENSHQNEMMVLLKMFVACLPIFLFVLAATNCFAFIMESNGASISTNLGVLLVIPLVSSLLGMKFEIFAKFSKILPYTMIQNISINMHPFSLVLPWKGNAGYYNCWIAGIIQMFLFMLIGYIIFNKKEVK